MGVPGFFSWLRRKYPQIVDECAKDQGQQEEEEGRGDRVCDNLYIGQITLNESACLCICTWYDGVAICNLCVSMCFALILTGSRAWRLGLAKPEPVGMEYSTMCCISNRMQQHVQGPLRPSK